MASTYRKIRQLLHRHGQVLSAVIPDDFQEYRNRYGGENSNRVPQKTCAKDYHYLCQVLKRK